MVNVTMKDHTINVDKFAAMGPNSGYRDYNGQIEAYINYRHGGNTASCPYFTKGTTLAKCIRSTAKNAKNTYAEAWIQENWKKYTNDGIWNDVSDSATSEGGDLFRYGGSNHGWGLALDMNFDKAGTTEHNWIKNNSSKYGFSPYTSEYWHLNHKQNS